jgi:hypothetical protein
MQAPSLVELYIIEAIGHSAAELQIHGTLADPTPSLKGAWGNVPATSQFYLVHMPYSHFALLRAGSRTREERGICGGRSRGGPGDDGEEEFNIRG